MKAVYSRIVAFLMVGVVLTLSTGMGLVEHTCLVSGKKSVFADKPHGCCAKKNQPAGQPETTLQQDQCCESSTVYLHIDFVALNEKVSQFLANLYLSVVEKVVHVFNALVQRSETACSYTNSSPPQSGRVLLLKLCTLQV